MSTSDAANAQGDANAVAPTTLSLAFHAVSQGFLNYFGLQRFGTREVKTHKVGAALVAGQWEKAVHLILGFKDGKRAANDEEAERPSKLPRREEDEDVADAKVEELQEASAQPKAPPEEEAEGKGSSKGKHKLVSEAQRVYLETGDAQRALDLMPRCQHLERCVLGARARGPEEGEEGQEPGAREEEGEFEEDQPIEIEEVRFDRQGAWTQAAPARRTARTNPPLTAFSVPPDLFDYAWDPHEREEAVWRDPSSRHQVLVSNNADVIPLDEQHIATDNEEDTADPNYFPGRRRSDELDPDQSDIEDQFLARVRPPSAHRSVYLDKGGAAPSAPAEESTATSSKGAAAPSAPARSSHSKIPKGYRSSDTPSPPTSVGRRPNSAGARAWFREEPTRLEAAYPRERSPRQRKPPPAPQGPKVAPVSQAVVRGYKDPPSADKIGCTIIPEKREPKKPVLKDPPKSLAKQPSTPPPDYPPGKAPPKFGEQQQLNPPPPRPGPPSRPPPVHTVINNPRPDPPELPKGAASSAPKAAGTSRGVAKGAPTSHRARQNYQPDEPDLSIFRRHGYNWMCHAVTEIPHAYDDHRITIGIDWHKTCTPLLLDGSFWAPTPLFAQQLREISEDYPVQFVIVSFSGWTGLDRTQWEVERFVAHCYTDLNLPFVGIQMAAAQNV
eukprot:symbB.v1.2.040336.t1/scaffold7155.1/size12999/1